MNKVSKEKRDRLIFVGMLTAVAVAGIWFLVIAGQNDRMAVISGKTDQIQDKLVKAQRVIKREEETEKKLQLRTEQLAEQESTLAPERDSYAWMLSLMNHFLQSRSGVRVTTISQPAVKADLDLIPRFPYKSAAFAVKGAGLYRDLGKFIADFENTFPLFQIQNLRIEPIGSLAPNQRLGEAETLQFELEIITPIKSAESVAGTK